MRFLGRGAGRRLVVMALATDRVALMLVQVVVDVLHLILSYRVVRLAGVPVKTAMVHVTAAASRSGRSHRQAFHRAGSAPGSCHTVTHASGHVATSASDRVTSASDHVTSAAAATDGLERLRRRIDRGMLIDGRPRRPFLLGRLIVLRLRVTGRVHDRHVDVRYQVQVDHVVVFLGEPAVKPGAEAVTAAAEAAAAATETANAAATETAAAEATATAVRSGDDVFGRRRRRRGRRRGHRQRRSQLVVHLFGHQVPVLRVHLFVE